MEGRWQVVAHAGHGDEALLHGLQQGRLRARAGAVDLVGHQQLGEDRPANEAEAALAAGGFIQHLGTENIGGHQIGRELDARAIKAQCGGHGGDKPRLGQARRADQEGMPAGQHGAQRQLDNTVLAEHGLADLSAHICQRFDGGFGFGNDFGALVGHVRRGILFRLRGPLAGVVIPASGLCCC